MFEIHQSRDGKFGVCVFRAEDLSDDQIHETFGQFGEIGRINRAKSALFVNFVQKEDAIKCLESMQNHPKLNVQPARQKKPQDDQNSRSSNENYTETMKSSGYGRRNEGGDKERSDGGFVKNRNNRDSARRDGNTLPPMPNLVKIFAPEPPVDPNTPKAKIVVIANLPHGFIQRNVYNICSSDKKGIKPLHIAMKKINRPPAPEVSYAYVYFKTEKEVNLVVEYLDDVIINGHSLVVKAVDKILEEEGK